MLLQNRYKLVTDNDYEAFKSYFTWGISTALNIMYSVKEADDSTHFYVYKRHYERSSAYMSPFFELSNVFRNMRDAYEEQPNDWEIVAVDAYVDQESEEQYVYIIT